MSADARRRGLAAVPAVVELGVHPELVEAIATRVVELLESRAGGPEPWIGVDEAAAHIGKPRSRVYDLVAEGTLRCGRDGRSLLFRRSDLDAYLLAHEQDAEAA